MKSLFYPHTLPRSTHIVNKKNSAKYYSHLLLLINNLSMVEPLIISDLGTLNNFYKKRVVAVTKYLFVFKGQPA